MLIYIVYNQIIATFKLLKFKSMICKKYSFFIVVTILISSCSIMKQKNFQGYYAKWDKSKSNKMDTFKESSVSSDELIVSISPDNSRSVESDNKILVFDNQLKDTSLLHNKIEISKQITRANFKRKEKQKIENYTISTITKKAKKEKSYQPLTWWAFGSIVTSILIAAFFYLSVPLAIAGFILISISVSKIVKNPGMYRSIGFNWTLLGIAIVEILVILLLLTVLLLYIFL